MNWIFQLVTAVLKWLEGLASKETHGETADPTAGGIRDRFRKRVQQHRDPRPPGNPGSTGGTR